MKAFKAFIFFGIFGLSALNAAERTPEEHRHFKDWCKKHGKKYRSLEEEEIAMENLLKHKEIVDAHNKEYYEGQQSFSMGLSDHHDLTLEQLKKLRGGIKVPPEYESRRSTRANYPNYPPGPSSIDWNDRGLVGPVRDQAQCGSCWAFSTAAIVYAVTAKKNRPRTTSPQQLVDCDKTAYTTGCKGGWPENSLDYVRMYGMASENEYPYKGYQSQCDYSNEEKVATVSQVFNIPTRGNETWLKDIVGSVGPVSIVLCLDESFYYYQHGVYKVNSCCTSHEHAPIITGYGTDPVEGDYWIIKNSWGL